MHYLQQQLIVNGVLQMVLSIWYSTVSVMYSRVNAVDCQIHIKETVRAFNYSKYCAVLL